MVPVIVEDSCWLGECNLIDRMVGVDSWSSFAHFYELLSVLQSGSFVLLPEF
jgi:hypothetical protein